MKKFLHSRYGASKGAALIIVLAFVVLATGLSLAYFSRTTTNRQLAQSSYTDTSADLLARSALDIVVSDLKQEIPLGTATPTITPSNIQPRRSGDDASIPNLIRRSVYPDLIPTPGVSSLASNVSSAPAPSATPRRGDVTAARWNSHYLIPSGANFTAPDWVLVTRAGPAVFSAWQDSLKDPTNNNYVVGRYAFAVYDEGGLIDVNLGGFPGYASLSRPTRPMTPRRRLPTKYPSEENEIMLAACQAPDLTPQHTNASGTIGVPIQPVQLKANHNPISFAVSGLPGGLSLDAVTGIISGIPTSYGGYYITTSASNGCGIGTGTLYVRIDGNPEPSTTPWPINLARKGTVAFADLTALPSAPTSTQINQLMGWRNYATTRQSGASFTNPLFPLASADDYASYFLGTFPPPNYVFDTPFTTVRNDPSLVPGRTDQAVMTRQELIKLQRSIGFSPSVLQYLGTFSRDVNRPSPDWSRTLATRWDMNNLQGVLPGLWNAPGWHGIGHAFGKQRQQLIGQLFGLEWEAGNFGTQGDRLTDPNYYGRWKYDLHNLTDWPNNQYGPDFFQIIYNAMKMGNGGVSPNPKDVFTVGAAIIDQYDADDLYDANPDPNGCNSNCGNTITIIDTVGNGIPADYVYGVEDMSWHDPTIDTARPGLYCPYPPMPRANYSLLNRRFENVGEFGYAYNPASNSARPSRTLDFASANSPDKPLLDFFTYNIGTNRAGIVNLNTRNVPVLASYIKGALLHDPGSENPIDQILSQNSDALAAGQAIVDATTATNGAAVNRGDVARLAAAAVAAVPNLATSDEAKQTIARALAEAGQARVWNLMIDVIAQTGHYGPNAQGLTDFIPESEKRYWLHIALDRDDGTVLGTQLEEVIE